MQQFRSRDESAHSSSVGIQSRLTSLRSRCYDPAGEEPMFTSTNPSPQPSPRLAGRGSCFHLVQVSRACCPKGLSQHRLGGGQLRAGKFAGPRCENRIGSRHQGPPSTRGQNEPIERTSVPNASTSASAALIAGRRTVRASRMRTFWRVAIRWSWICCRHNRRHRARLNPWLFAASAKLPSSKYWRRRRSARAAALCAARRHSSKRSCRSCRLTTRPTAERVQRVRSGQLPHPPSAVPYSHARCFFT